jgi:hypothetical protein
LIGAVSQEVLETISQFGLDSYLNNLGYVSHGEAIAHQRKSQVLHPSYGERALRLSLGQCPLARLG